MEFTSVAQDHTMRKQDEEALTLTKYIVCGDMYYVINYIIILRIVLVTNDKNS